MAIALTKYLPGHCPGMPGSGTADAPEHEAVETALHKKRFYHIPVQARL